MVNKHAAAWSGITQVAHTGGLFRGTLYTSSRDAICKNFLDGFRHFEIDVVGLGDGNSITAHDGTEGAFVRDAIPYAKAKISDIKFKQPLYTIVRLEELCEMAATLGVYFIVDVKNLHTQVYRHLYQLAKTANVLDRMIPQAYDEATLATVREIGFPLHLMTLWGIGDRSSQEKIDFCRKHRPSVVWMWAKWATPEFVSAIRDCGAVEIGVHGEMTREACLGFMSRGIHVMNDCMYIHESDTEVLRKKTRAQIEAMYRLHLGRRPDAPGLEQKLEAVVSGRKSILDIQGDILLSGEFRNRVA